jgi:hypothetical protein
MNLFSRFLSNQVPDDKAQNDYRPIESVTAVTMNLPNSA